MACACDRPAPPRALHVVRAFAEPILVRFGRLLEKTDTTNRTALVRRALQLGYLSLDDRDAVG